MAQLTARGKKVWRIQFFVAGARHSITFHGPRIDAEKLRGNIGQLEQNRKLNLRATPEVAEWARGLSTELKVQLIDTGLIDLSDTGGTLQDLIDYGNRVLSDIADRTKINYRQVHESLVEFFGASRPLSSITPASAEEFRRSLTKRYGAASIAKRIKHSRQLFKLAEQQGWVAKNPFAGLRVAVKIDSERRVFVDRETADRVLAGLPDPEDRLVFALARYGGLRVGSEIRTLRWKDIELDTWVMRLRATKTDSMRVCPIFTELQPYFLALTRGAPEDLVCPHFCSGADTAFRSRLIKCLNRLKIAPWPDLMLNCRRSRATEIVERWGSRAESDWIGHGADISLRHYQMTLQSKIDEAVGRTGAP